jgi:hypothetical protein
MSLIVVFSILFSHYYLEPRNEFFRERYNKIVNDFVNLKDIDIKEIQILYKKEGSEHFEYNFKILSKKIISEFQYILSKSYRIDNVSVNFSPFKSARFYYIHGEFIRQ